MFHANMAGRLAKRLGLVPAVVCSERIVGWESPARIWLNRMTVRSADAITTNSFAGARFWSERLRIPVQAIHVIYNGVDLQEFVPPVQPAHTPTIAVLAQLHRRNGHDWLIDALKQLHRTVAAPWNCVFAGIGPEESRLRAAVSNAGLDNRVRFAGHCADAPQFYQSAAIAVHPALVSGMPNAVIEAMASGLPVVATAVGGTPEVVEHRRTGFLVEPGDARTTAEYLAWLVTNPEARAEMGHAGRRRAEEQFSIDIAVAHTERVLTDLAARKGLATQDSEAGTILRTI
jgi:glycosyltransferase involved in cell wall biosynthesis